MYLIKKGDLKVDIATICKTMSINEDITLEELEEKIHAIDDSIHDYEIQYEMLKELREKLIEYKQRYFTNQDLDELGMKIQSLVNSTKNDIKFLENNIYNLLIKEISKKFKYDDFMLMSREKLYSLLNLLYIHKGKLNKEDKLIYFDEGQDINYFDMI